MDPKLYAAAISGDVKMFTNLQDHSLNILQEVTPTRNTALHVAAYHGHVKVVKKLIQMVRDIEAASQASALVARHGSLEDVETLIRMMNCDIEAGIQASGEFLRARNKEGNTVFHEAAIGGCYEVIKVLLEYDGDLVNMINDAGETALFKAVEGGHKKIFKELLHRTSSQYDRRTLDGQTLVQCTVCNKQKGVLKELIDVKPDLLQQADNLGRTPLHSAAYLDGISHITRILIKTDKYLCYKVDAYGQLPLHIAVIEGNLDLVKEILKYAKDCKEIVDNDGRNSLHLVIENAVHIYSKISRRIKTMVLLVVSKRLINTVDNRGKTTLDIAMDNMDSDKRLFNGIIWFLEINGARRTQKMTQHTSNQPFTTKKPTLKVQIISVNAVLIATGAFAAAFTLPAFTLPKEGKKHHLVDVFFQAIVICIALAFCSSISSAVLLMYALYGKQEDPLILETSMVGLWIALISLLLGFGAAIHVTVAAEYIGVAAIVLGMVTITPICIRLMILRSKKYIFRDDAYYLWTFIIYLVTQTIVSYFSLDRLIIVIIVGIILLHLARKGLGFLVRRKCLKFLVRREVWNSKEAVFKIIIRDTDHMWYFIWYMVPTFLIFDTYIMSIICYSIWMIIGICAFIGRRIYFRSKQKFPSNDDLYIWFLTFITGLGVNAITTLITALVEYNI